MPVSTTIVPASQQRPPGELATLDLRYANAEIRRAINTSTLANSPFIGAWDFSFNEDATKKHEPHWQAHLQGIFLTAASAKTVTLAIGPRFTARGLVRRPVRSRVVVDPVQATSYALKSIFFRRVSYLDTQNVRNTRTLPLRAHQQHELSIFLHNLALSDRIFLHLVRIGQGEFKTKNSVRTQPATL